MLKVVFWGDWFSPSGQLYRKSDPKNPSGARDVPEDEAGWDAETRKAKNLPSTAQVVSADDRPAPRVKPYVKPSHALDPQHVTDMNNRRRELEEQEAARKAAAEKEERLLGEQARDAKDAAGLGTRVTEEQSKEAEPPKDSEPVGGETELEKALREAEETRNAAAKAASDTAAAGKPKKKKG